LIGVYAYTEVLHSVQFSVPCTDAVQKLYLSISDS
jgi:hypothetical protein